MQFTEPVKLNQAFIRQVTWGYDNSLYGFHNKGGPFSGRLSRLPFIDGAYIKLLNAYGIACTKEHFTISQELNS